MVRISRIGGADSIGGGRPAPAATSGGFSVGTGQVEQAAKAPATQPAGLAGMLALQEAQGDSAENKRGKRHGLAMLDGLLELQRGLLQSGGNPADMAALMAGLARLAENPPVVADAELAAALSAIRLRAKIELLRRGVDPG